MTSTLLQVSFGKRVQLPPASPDLDSKSVLTVPLLNRQRFPIVVTGVQNTGCHRDKTLLEQCDVEDVFGIHSLALRASIRIRVGVDGCVWDPLACASC